MATSAVIVTFNRLNLLKESLNNLLNQSAKLDYIFVINNNSTDGTTEYLNSLDYPFIKSFSLKNNLGGAGGFSLGIKLAFEQSDSNYFWLMDDDTMPINDSLFQLEATANKLHQKFSFLSSNVKWWKNNVTTNVPQPSDNWTKMIDKNLITIKSASFVSLFVNRIMVQKLGLPISEMFIWGDDIEYTTRLFQEENGYFVPNSIVIHKSAENNMEENIFNAPLKRMFYYKCMYRNRLYTYKKYYNPRHVIKYILSNLLVAFKIPFLSKNKRFKRLFNTLAGIANGVLFNPKINYPNNIYKGKNNYYDI